MTEEQGRLIDKAETATIAAAIIVVLGATATVYYGKWELFAMIVGAAVAYLFPKKKTE